MEACSGGEQQRLKFALALVPDPDLVILDEPTTGMDVGARQEFWEAMRADAALGRTIVFATHYLAEADEFAERTVLMSRGRIVARRPTADVRAAYGGRTAHLPAARRRRRRRRASTRPGWPGRRALAPLGVTGLEVSGRQPRGRLPRPDRGVAAIGRAPDDWPERPDDAPRPP